MNTPGLHPPGPDHRSAPRSWSTWLVAFACAATIASVLRYGGHEGPWYKISTVMHHPTTAAVTGTRLLLPTLAALLQKLVPGLTDLDCFFATQLVIIGGTVYLSGEWVASFLPRLGRLFGYVALTVVLCPTMNYWTFYDIAIVGFWTACLLLLHHERYGLYLLIFAIATLNHENNLLLIPVTFLFGWRHLPTSRLTVFLVSQLSIYLGIRLLVHTLVPTPAIVELGLRQNVFFWRYNSLQTLAFTWSVLISWWLLAFAGFKSAPRILRCAAVSLPGLFLVTTLFGRYEEARQFDAFIPTSIGLIACWVRSQTETSA